MDDTTLSTSWPAAPRGSSNLVQHPAWEEARNAILDLAAEGPVTVFLTGEPGSGKTWLLRELAASFGQHGFPTMMLLRGDLPVPLSDGAAVLVDEASYMAAPIRVELATQDRSVVILADIEPFTPELDDARTPVCIHLRLLRDDEIGPFAASWLGQAGVSAAILDPGGLARLIHHSAGAVRVAAQLLNAATAAMRANRQLHLTAEMIDEVAGFRIGTPRPLLAVAPVPIPVSRPAPIPAPAVIAQSQVEPPHIPAAFAAPSGARQARRLNARWLYAGAALAASVAGLVVLPAWLSRSPTVEATALPQPAPTASAMPPIVSAQLTPPPLLPAPSPAATMPRPAVDPTTLADNGAEFSTESERPAPEALPPLQAAEIPSPYAVAASPSDPAAVTSTPSLAAAAPEPTPTRAGSPQTAAVAMPLVIAAAPPPVVVPVILTATVSPPPVIARRSAPGLILVAQRGDTLERLYADVYRDRHAPPYAEILAANPQPFKPGAIVVFPEPIGGWRSNQR